MTRVKQAIDSLPVKTGLAIKTNTEQIADLNRENQLYFKGIDAKGQKLKKYTKVTVAIKRALGKPFDRTTLLDKGDFYEKFKIDFNPNDYTITIFSTDEKTPKLIAKYGIDIFGLTPENNQYLDENIIKPYIDKWLQTIL